MDTDRLDPNDEFDRVMAVTFQAEMRPGAEKLCKQYERGLLTVRDLRNGLEKLECDTRESILWRSEI